MKSQKPLLLESPPRPVRCIHLSIALDRSGATNLLVLVKPDAVLSDVS
jgi:hypothetical protein